MSSSYGQCSLFLHPFRCTVSPEDVRQLISALQEMEFISHEIIGQEKNSYYTGKHFLDHIAYMGCAPSIQFEAGEHGENFCYVKLHRYNSAKLIYSQTQSRAPHCPDCKKPVKDWQQSKTETTIKCDSCDTTANIESFNWRKTAGYARLFIEITDIFPKEAIPQQSLLDRLAEITNTEWKCFYSCQ